MEELLELRAWAKRRWPMLALGSLAFLVYAISSGSMFWKQSNAPHFIYQADAFLKGQLALAADPPNLNDWVLEKGRWFVSFPSFPAILMLPFVWVNGLQFNDVPLTVLFGSLNVALVWLLLRRLSESGDSARSPGEDAVLALLFGFGTLAWYCCIRGEVWFTAETIGVTLTCAYLLAAHRAAHPFLAGLFLALGAATRTPIVFATPFFLGELVIPNGQFSWNDLKDRRYAVIRSLSLFILASIIVGLPFLWMNYERFGDWSEFGHRHLFNNRVNDQIAHYGLFSYQFLERNLHDAFTRLPLIRSVYPPRIDFDGEGMSLFITTPLFLFLLRPKQVPRLHRVLWITVACVALPGFFYQNSGYYQFGYRFSLDYTPELMVLLAVGGHRLRGWAAVAGIAGVVVNAWGAFSFLRS